MQSISLKQSESGFVYIFLLAAIALLSLGLSIIGPRWALAAQREREQRLIEIGFRYVSAIEDYYVKSPGAKDFPVKISELIEDPRFLGTVRHMRELYEDPFTPGEVFRPVLNENGKIIGVASLGADRPLLETRYTDGRHELLPAEHYADWQFLARVDDLNEKSTLQ